MLSNCYLLCVASGPLSGLVPAPLTGLVASAVAHLMPACYSGFLHTTAGAGTGAAGASASSPSWAGLAGFLDSVHGRLLVMYAMEHLLIGAKV